MRAVILLLVNVVILCSFAGCERPAVTQNQAREIAKKKIKSYESMFKIDANKLPPFSERINDGFDFWVEDESQNIWLFVHVSPTGLSEASGERLDKFRRDGERVQRDLEETRKKRSGGERK